METSNNEFNGSDDIAVIGMACRLPGAENYRQFCQNLYEWKESFTQLTDEELREAGVSERELADPNYVKAGMFLENMECFDAGFFGFSPQDARILDPQHRHFLECAWEAFEDAGYIPDQIEGSVGVFAGSGHNAYMPFNLLTNPDLVDQVGFFLLRHTGNDKDFLATRASYIFNLLGPSINVQTACSTSLVAVHNAAQSLLNGECTMALAGGVTIELPHRQGYLYKENEVLSADGHCRPFEAASGGTVFGSGVGCVVLKRLDDAIADGDPIHAVIKSSAINNDGANKVSYLAPSVDGQASAIREALEIADIDPSSVSYIECHGTGTEMGDPIEVAALTQAYGQDNPKKQYCALGSVKSNIGHLDTAAGVAGMIKAILSLKHKKIPATLHFNAPNPAINFPETPFYVNDRLRDWNADTIRRAAVSSLGVGGTNAHVVLEEAHVEQTARDSVRPFQLLTMSARSPQSLDDYKSKYQRYFEENDQSLADITYTAAVSRKQFKHRYVAVAADHSGMQQVLDDAKHGLGAQAKALDANGQLNFLFAGGGAQHIDMGKGLYEHAPLFKAIIDQCLAHVDTLVEFDLRAILFPSAEKAEWARDELMLPSRALPALLAIQYAQARLWQSWGIEPHAMIGHSMGEYTAACLAGVFSIEDALAIVIKRGELFEKLPRGAMLSVMLDRNALDKYLDDGLSVAAVNSETLCVLSGPEERIEAVSKRLEADEVQFQRVHIAVAAHSSMLDPVLQEFEDFLQGITYHAPKMKVVSNLTGSWLTAEQATDPKYWVRHLRETVRFSEGISLLLEGSETEEQAAGAAVFLEVGPGNTLSSLARQNGRISRHHIIQNSMRHPKEQEHDYAYMLLALGRIWCHGYDVDWSAFYAEDQEQQRIGKVSIPTYPFEKQKHWVAPGKQTGLISKAERLALDDWFYQPAWQLAFMPEGLLSQPEVPTILVGNDAVPLVRALSEIPKVKALTSAQDGEIAPDFEAMFNALTAEGLKQCNLVYALPLTPPDEAGQNSHAFEQFFHFAQSLVEQDVEQINLVILTQGAFALHPSENIEHPELAMIQGAARV
ncbi:MAG: type I polyketide synthase, partial [Oleiphilaceae bacterium]|nr:type I polyketide synthase [Oleiphilaceae bacterium]